jgi:hypothetical protein
MKHYTKVFELSNKQQVCFRCDYDHERHNYFIEGTTYVRETFFRELTVYDTYDEMKRDFERHYNAENAENFARYAYNEVDVLEDERLGLPERLN